MEEQVELNVKATVGEWANILMMPSFPTLVAYQPLTANFQPAYMGIAHDVMMKKMKRQPMSTPSKQREKKRRLCTPMKILQTCIKILVRK